MQQNSEPIDEYAAIDDMDTDESPVESEQGNSEFEVVIDEIKKLCATSKLDFIEDEFLDDKMYYIQLPNGRDKRRVYIGGRIRARQLLDLNFQKYVFLGDYDAICSYENGEIIAGVRSLNSVYEVSRKLFNTPRGETLGKTLNTVEISQDNIQTKLRIELVSGREYKYHPLLSSRNRIFLRISGMEVTRHDEAVSLLERLSNALFFEIDLALGSALTLSRSRSLARARRYGRRAEQLEIEFPKNEYDPAPISLYWYARSASGMPLLQYLAFYQILEFYFPVYARKEAARKVRSRLKDPTFRVDRDADIAKIISAIEGGARGAFGDERSQLRATLSECVDAGQLEEFYKEDETRTQFFSQRQKGLTNQRINMSSTSDIIFETANLIYDLRCKIVHTKGEEHGHGQDLLLPFTREADLLSEDVELIQYLAKQVLISSSTPLEL